MHFSACPRSAASLGRQPTLLSSWLRPLAGANLWLFEPSIRADLVQGMVGDLEGLAEENAP